MGREEEVEGGVGGRSTEEEGGEGERDILAKKGWGAALQNFYVQGGRPRPQTPCTRLWKVGGLRILVYAY